MFDLQNPPNVSQASSCTYPALINTTALPLAIFLFQLHPSAACHILTPHHQFPSSDLNDGF